MFTRTLPPGIDYANSVSLCIIDSYVYISCAFQHVRTSIDLAVLNGYGIAWNPDCFADIINYIFILVRFQDLLDAGKGFIHSDELFNAAELRQLCRELLSLERI